jgi:hypothetical protein
LYVGLRLLSCAGAGRLTRFVCAHCTATGKLSSRCLFLNRAAVRRHIAASRPCHAADAGIRTIQEARAGDVMAGAGGAAGPTLDVQHQPAGDVHPQFLSKLTVRSQPVAVAFLARQAPPWGPVNRADWARGEEGCRKRCTAQAGSRDKTGSQDGSSLIPSKVWYISVCSMYRAVRSITWYVQV